MKKRKSIILILLVAFLLLAVAILCIWNYSYTDSILGNTYRIDYNMYSSFYETYGPPQNMYLSKTGRIYSCLPKNGIYEPSVITTLTNRIILTEKNFDNILLGDRFWSSPDMDAKSLRAGNKATWVLKTDGFTTGYLMLQQNGDLLYCYSAPPEEFRISEIFFLENMGDRSDFDSYVESLNDPQNSTTTAPTIEQQQVHDNVVQITAPSGSVTNSNTHNGETYSFELRYDLDFLESAPNTIVVTLYATNLGKSIEYQGNESHLFSLPTFTLVSEEITYAFPKDFGLSDAEATPRVFKTGETVSNTYHISIPDDAPAGCYNMNFFIRTVQGEFEDVLTVSIAEQTAFPVADSHFTVANDTLIPENTAYAPYLGYIDTHDPSTADRIAEVKKNNGVLPSLGMIQLTFQDELPRSVTWKTFDRYGTADKNDKKIITNPADVTILNIDMPLGLALNSSLDTAHEWYVEITCVYSDRTVAYLLVMEIPPITP